MPVLVTDDGDIFYTSYGPHDRAGDNPLFTAIPSEGYLHEIEYSSDSRIVSSYGGRDGGYVFYGDLPVTRHVKPLPPRLGAPLAASPTRTAKRVPVGAPAAQRSESSTLPPTPGRGKKKSKCPKGHYWSYKHKKCISSKF